MIRRRHAHLLARPWLVVLVTCLLAAPTLFGGLAADDRIHRRAACGEHGPWWGPWNLFSFCPDDAAAREALRARDVVGWWASPALKVEFWRPFTSLTHWIDDRLLGDIAWPMHLQNIAWYAAIVALACGIFRKLVPGPGWAWAALQIVMPSLLPSSRQNRPTRRFGWNQRYRNLAECTLRGVTTVRDTLTHDLRKTASLRSHASGSRPRGPRILQASAVWRDGELVVGAHRLARL
jgi:hypothetical protein